MRFRLVVLASALAVCAVGCTSAPTGVTLPPLTTVVSTAAVSTSAVGLSSQTAGSGSGSTTFSMSSESASETSVATEVSSTLSRSGTASPSDRVNITIPDSIQGAERDSAIAAIIAFGHATEVSDQALSDPTAKDWTADIRSRWAAIAQDRLIYAAGQFGIDGWKQVGQDAIWGVVSGVVANVVTLEACFDEKNVDIHNASGESVIASHDRRRMTVEVNNYGNPYGWLVTSQESSLVDRAC